MKITRRQFVRNGVAAFTVTYAAPAFLSDIARAQGSRARNLVVLYLSGGNDALSMLAPYTDPFYYSRRPTIAVPPGVVLQVGSDASRVALGLHPRLTGLRQIFNDGRLALIQRTGYANQSRSHFQGTDIWSTADPSNPSGFGWVGRFLDSLPTPVDALIGWNTTRDLPRVLQSDHVAVPAIPSASTYAFASPNPAGPEAAAERDAAVRISSHVPVNQPHLAFVYESSQKALATIDRVGTVASYGGTVAYANNGFSQALKAVAGAMVRGIGTRVFYVTTGGFDTHSQQGVNTAGSYVNLMGTLNDGLASFYNDLRNQGLLDDTLVLTFSEFGRRIDENGSAGTDHGAASVMMAMGGRVNGGIYGTAPNLSPGSSNETLENNSSDVRFETDFRSVYARVIDQWLGADSRSILNGDFRQPGLAFV
ncbi:MAG TPA: DUF1501 domain-containing protein [Vicinamibacterales bacterium]|nr:DUF1501 domain-containing protein [Vicinamibacterales bacterium]